MKTLQKASWRVLRGPLLSLIMILALLLPAAQPVASAQADQRAPVDADDPEAADRTRLVGYGLVISTPNADGSVQFSWETNYEAGVVGFNVWADGEGGAVQLNEQLIPATGFGSLEPQSYTYTATTDAAAFFIEHVTTVHETARSPRYLVGEQIGESASENRPDWDAIRAEKDAFTENQRREGAARVNRALDAIHGSAPAADEPLVEQTGGTLNEYTTFLPLITDHGDGTQQVEAEAADLAPNARIELHVSEDGIYRVTHDDFVAAGFDLTGVTSAYLALTNRGEPVRMRVVAPSTSWGPVNSGDPFIEFVGEALDTLYTDTNIYVLQVDRTKAFRVFTNLREPDMTESAPDSYTETLHVNTNQEYSFGSQSDDPWYLARLYSITPTPDVVSFELPELNNVADDTSSARLRADYRGGIAYEHHLQIELNGQVVLDDTFSNFAHRTPDVAIPNGLLQGSGNQAVVQLTGGTSDPYDIVEFESFSVEYPRRFVVQNGQLDFAGAAKRFRVDGFDRSADSTEYLVYSTHRNRQWRMAEVTTTSTGLGFAATFPGWGDEANYFVSTVDEALSPTIQAGRPAVDLLEGDPFDFVIIAPEQFIAGLQPFVAARTADGYDVRVVDVADIYAQYNYSIFDASAIRSYLIDAIEQLGVRYVMLVGGDTYDYRDFLQDGSVSHIPSLYMETHSQVTYGAVDPKYVDTNDNNRPNAAIGRLPVRTPDELTDVISKILTYDSRTYDNEAVFVADAFVPSEGVDYKGLSNQFVDTIQNPSEWSVETVYLDDYYIPDPDDPDDPPAMIIDVKSARADLRALLNSGPAFVSYLGHSAPTRWTFLGLLSGTQVTRLSNADKPMVVVQWGCWNTYYVSPKSDSMAHQFLLSGNRGAASIMGATGLTYVSSDVRLSKLLTPLMLEPGKPIGDALLEAKNALAATASPIDVMLGWTLMGDPTLVVD